MPCHPSGGTVVAAAHPIACSYHPLGFGNIGSSGAYAGTYDGRNLGGVGGTYKPVGFGVSGTRVPTVLLPNFGRTGVTGSEPTAGPLLLAPLLAPPIGAAASVSGTGVLTPTVLSSNFGCTLAGFGRTSAGAGAAGGASGSGTGAPVAVLPNFGGGGTKTGAGAGSDQLPGGDVGSDADMNPGGGIVGGRGIIFALTFGPISADFGSAPGAHGTHIGRAAPG